MQTTIAPELINDPRAIAAEKVLRKCVHCGFCLATCPTYNLVGDELDSPRGRIYLVKQVVEGKTPTATTQSHLDRCLTCRSCETTCPSGVEYGQLIDQGRALVEESVKRPFKQRVVRGMILKVLPYASRIGPLVKLGQWVRPLMPGALRRSIPLKQVVDAPANTTRRTSAVSFHLNATDDARDFMRRNIDAWWPAIEAGAEAIIVTASGCGVMVKDYGHVLADDPAYKDKAQKVSDLCRDIVEVVAAEDLSCFHDTAASFGRIAFHPPCTLQHGQQLPQVTEALLQKLGFQLTAVPDSHLCCGSAGTYSIFQPELSQQLRDNKVKSVLSGDPDIIATANIGCQLQLQTGLGRPVVHWVELLDRLLVPS